MSTGVCSLAAESLEASGSESNNAQAAYGVTRPSLTSSGGSKGSNGSNGSKKEIISRLIPITMYLKAICRLSSL